MTVQALFVRDGDWYVPTAYTTGPWRPDAMHGGPPSALIGLAIHANLETGQRVARINIDLEKPVPLLPLRTTVLRRQVSRRVTHVYVELVTDSAIVATARALLLQEDEPVPLIDRALPVAPPLTGPQSASRGGDAPHGSALIFHRDAIEARFTKGDWAVPGSADAWMRLTVPLILGEPTPALCELLAIADFGSPLGQAVAPGAAIALINVDVNVTLSGTPSGPWFHLTTQGTVSDHGIGLAVTNLADENGYLGVITQSQLTQKYGRT